jgi:hypothetical protein
MTPSEAQDVETRIIVALAPRLDVSAASSTILEI